MPLDFKDPFEEDQPQTSPETTLDFKDPFEAEQPQVSTEGLSEPNRLRAEFGFPLIEDAPAAIPEPEGRTILGTAGDIGVSALKGAVGLVQAGVGLADIPTGGRVGKAIEEYTPLQLKETQKILESWYTDPQKKAFEEVAETKGFLPTVGAMLERPSTILHAGIESAPSMIGGAGIARGALKVAPKLGMMAMAGGEGAIAAGMSAEQLREQAESGLLTGREAVAAIGLGLGTGFFGLLGGRVAQKLGIADIDVALAGLGSDVGEKGVLRRIVEGGISEGMLEELPQSMQEQVWMNAAQNKPLMEGVPESAAAGMLVGFGMGAGANIFTGRGAKAIPTAPAIEGQDTVDAAIKEDVRKPTLDEIVEEQYQKQQAARPEEVAPEKESDIETLLREIKEAKAEEAAPADRARVQGLVDVALERKEAIPIAPIESQDTIDEQIKADIAPEVMPGELPTPDTEAQQAYFQQMFADTQAAMQPEAPIQAEVPMAIPTEEVAPTERRVGERDGMDLIVDDATGDLIVEHPSGSRMIERTVNGDKQYEVIGDYADFGVTKDEVDLKNAREAVDPDPTQAQIEAGNAKLGHLKVQGMAIGLENAKGDTRKGEDDGVAWETEMHHDYGKFKGTKGADGDEIDVYIGPNLESDTAHVVHQIDPKTGKYDEDKVMIGFDSQREAEAAYRKQYDQGMKKKPNRIGAVTSIGMDVLKEKMKANETIGAEAIKQIEYKPAALPRVEAVTEPSPKEAVPAPKPEIAKEVREEEIQEGDIRDKAGEPFKTKQEATLAIVSKKLKGYKTAKVEKGWVGRKKEVKIIVKKAEIIPTRAGVVAVPIEEEVKPEITVVKEKDLQVEVSGAIFNREETKRRLKDGLYIHDRIPESARDKARGSNLETASNVAKGVPFSGRAAETTELSQIQNPIDKRAPAAEIRALETKALRKFAKENDLLITDFETNLTEKGNSGGGEAYVYYDASTDLVMKSNFFAFTPTFADLFDRVMIHNHEFKSTAYKLEGFTEVKGEFLPVFSQPKVTETKEVSADEKERLAAESLKERGFKEVRDAYPWPWQDITDSKFVNSEGVVVSDINATNVFYVDGKIAFVDPIIEMDPTTKTERVLKSIGAEVAKPEKLKEEVAAEHDGEPVTETETKEILKDAKEEAKDEGIAPAEQKTFLLSEIDEALKDAPPQEDKPARMFDKVKIEVPGDGTFDIINTKEALTEFKALVKKNFPGKEAAKRVTKKYITPKPTAGKAKALKDVRQGVYEDKPYHTDGHIILLTKPALKPKQIEDSRWEDKPTIEAGTLKGLIPKGGDKVTDIEFVAYGKGESQSISNLPIPDLREDKRFTGAPKARLINEKSEVYIGQEYYNYVIRHFPNATFYTTDEVSPVLVKDGKKTVGIVMPIRIEGEEKMVLRAEGKPEIEKKETPKEIIEPEEEVKVAEDIEDFGEKLGGARKDIVTAMRKELSDDEIIAQPLSKIWPKSDIDGIESTFIASLATTLRSAIPSKPRKGYKVARWAEQVKSFRGLMQVAFELIEEGKLDETAIMNKLSEEPRLRPLAAKIDLLQSIDRQYWNRIGIIKEYPNAIRYEDNKQVPSPFVAISINGKYHSFEKTLSIAEVIDDITKILEEDAPAKIKKMAFEVRGRGTKFFINKKGDGEYRKLKTFETAADAIDYRKDHYNELVAEWEAVKERDNVKKADVRNKENRPRTGDDYRKGENATAEMFNAAFGFRGVEFGNWVKQGKNAKERQGLLNQAFDAFMDLANIVGVPPKAISLNGDLGLGLGSRGHGAASAHYEPGKIIINLTKTRGAGALAHEWFHALDNYFQRQRGVGPTRETSYITYNPKEDVEGVRIEVAEVFEDLITALDESPMKGRAAMLDKGTGYWSRIIERSARAFENYIISKMTQQGYDNDYLANVTKVEDFKRDIGRYPYLLDEELAPVEEAFDNLFEVIETRETDKGVAMFKRKDYLGEGFPVEKVGDKPSTSDIRAIVDFITTKWKNAPEIKVVHSIDKLPQDLQDYVKSLTGEGAIKGLFYKGKVYLIANNISSGTAAAEVLFHEALGHYGLRGMLGQDIRPVLNQVYIKYRKEAQRVAKLYGIDLSKEAGRMDAAEEVLAGIAQNNSDIGILAKVVAAIRNWLRKAGFDISLSDKDIKALVARAARFVKRGERRAPVPERAPVFSRADDSATHKDTRKLDAPPSKAVQGIKQWAKRNWTKEGLLNKVAFEQRIEMESAKNVGEADIAAMVTDFNKVVSEAYNKKQYNQVSEKDLADANSFMAGEEVTLPEGLKGKLQPMRDMLDNLSDGMIKTIKDMGAIQREKLSQKEEQALQKFLTGEKDGYLPKSMQRLWDLYETINKNKGSYLNRSYQAFDDPKWKDKTLANEDLMLRAEEFIKENNPDLTEGEVSGAVSAILQSAKESGNFMSLVSKGSKLGAKDVSIITKRKDVPDIILELLGEYKDPKINFVRSASKMQYFIANHNFLMGLRRTGLDTFLFDKPTINEGGSYDAEIAGEATETMNPLNGLYTTEDFKQGLLDATDSFVGSELMRNIIRVNSMVKYGKTILSPTTQARNFMSASMFSIMNGHFNWSHMGKAFKAARADLFTKDKEWREYLNKLTKIGVIHDNPYSGELRDAIKDFTELDVYSKGPAQNFRRVLDFFQRSYQVGDDFWKIIGYENEIALQKKTGLSQEEAEKKAAFRIRNGYPTYSMVPRGIKAIRRWPLIGTFVSFPYEIVRTTKSQLDFIKEDMANPETKGLAARRALGFAVASSVAYGASIASMALMGLDADDDEAIRNQLPKWSRNSQLFYTGYDKDGLPTYLDLSYLDPYTYLKKPLSALLSGNNEGIDKKIGDALGEFLDPFIGADIAAGALGELVFNQKLEGGTIYNPEDQGFDKATDILNHIRKAVQPGMVSNMERTIKAIEGDISRSGKIYSLKDEGLAWIGFRFGTLNIAQSMIYKGFGFKDKKTQSTRILNYTVGSASKVSESEINRAVRSMIKSRRKTYNDMNKLIIGAQKIGMKAMDIRQSLRAAGVSNEDISFLIAGRSPRWYMSKGFLEDATKRAKLSAPNAQRRLELVMEMRNRLNIVRRAALKEQKD